MTLQLASAVDALHNFASRTGLFDAVVDHEPKSSPSATGVSCALWLGDIRTVAGASGLASVSVRVEYMYRLYTSMLSEPQDAIDPRIADATDQLFSALCGSFTLSGVLRNIVIFDDDSGEGLRARPGYINIDRAIFRTMDITVPMLIDDVYTEAP